MIAVPLDFQATSLPTVLKRPTVLFVLVLYLNGFNYMLCSIHIIRIFLKFLTSTNWFPVISYPSHSVPFLSSRTHVRFIMVISYPVWSFFTSLVI